MSRDAPRGGGHYPQLAELTLHDVSSTSLLLATPGEVGPLIREPWGLIAPAITLLPLATHRLLEFLAMQLKPSAVGELALHTIPPLGMVIATLALWRTVPPLPGGPPTRVPGQRALSIAAGLLLGALAALANLLAVLAGSGPAGGAVTSGVSPAVVALVVHVTLLAPIAEELAFRGLIYRHLRRAMRPLAATILSALVFAVMHATLSQGSWAFVLGLFAAFAYEQTRSLLTPTLIHGLFNAVPVGVAVVKAAPDDLGPLWLVLLAMALVFTFAARQAGRASLARLA